LGIKFGEIDSGQILDNEFRIMVLESVVDRILQTSPQAAKSLDMNAIRHKVVADLQKKYPNSGIGLKG